MSDRLEFREAINVPEAIEKDRLIRLVRQIRAEAVLDKNTWEHLNATHPDWKPIDTSFEDATIAWCDGKGPLPRRSEWPHA